MSLNRASQPDLISTLPGRIRIRTKRLRSRTFNASMCQRIEAIEGVESARPSPAASSIIIGFNPDDIAAETIEQAATAILQEMEKKRQNRINLSTGIKAGMAVTLTSTLAYAILGKKKPHIAWANAFLVFTTLHVIQNTRQR